MRYEQAQTESAPELCKSSAEFIFVGPKSVSVSDQFSIFYYLDKNETGILWQIKLQHNNTP